MSDADLTFSAPADFNGSETFTVSVADAELTDSQIITVTINAVNDAPALVVVDDQTMQEGGTKAVLLSGSDIDEDALTYSVTQGTDITSSIDGATITFSVNDDNWNGSESFTATVSDGEFTSDQTFTVTVEGVNDAPVLATVSDVSFDEDASGSVSLSASDIDGDDLTYSVAGGTDITATLDGSDITFSAPTDFNGSEQFTVTVTDGSLDDYQNITVTVNAVNDAPIAYSSSIITSEDQFITIALYADDVDGDILEYLVSTNPVNGSIIIDGSFATYTPNADYNGEDSFTFYVNDGIIESNIAEIVITINPVNDALILEQIDNVFFRIL